METDPVKAVAGDEEGSSAGGLADRRGGKRVAVAAGMGGGVGRQEELEWKEVASRHRR